MQCAYRKYSGLYLNSIKQRNHTDTENVPLFPPFSESSHTIALTLRVPRPCTATGSGQYQWWTGKLKNNKRQRSEQKGTWSQGYSHWPIEVELFPEIKRRFGSRVWTQIRPLDYLIHWKAVAISTWSGLSSRPK